MMIAVTPEHAILIDAAKTALDVLGGHLDRYDEPVALARHLIGTHDCDLTTAGRCDLDLMAEHHAALHQPDINQAQKALDDLIAACTITAADLAGL